MHFRRFDQDRRKYRDSGIPSNYDPSGVYVVDAFAGHQTMHQYRMRYTKRIKRRKKYDIVFEQKRYQRSQ